MTTSAARSGIRTDVGNTPVLVAAFAICAFVGLDTTMKFLGHALPLEQTVLLRYAVSLPFCLALFIRRPQRPSLASLRANALRAVLVVVLALSFFYSVSVLPLAEAMAIQFLAPFFIAILGRVILKEPLHRRILVGLGIGFAGILVILWGQIGGRHGDRALWGALAALAAALAYALSNVLVRRQSGRDSLPLIVLAQNLGATLLLTAPGAMVWQPVDGRLMMLFVAVALLGTIGQVAMIWALARAQAARLAVLEYTAFLWASLFGYLVFREVPAPTTLAGAAIIVGACLYALRQPKRAA